MKRISVTVRLNRSTLQFDDAAHARLENYLAESASLLEGDPDPQEILGDLEQAVADQCARRLRPDQTVVTLAELVPALEEIGSVQTPTASASLPSKRRAPRRGHCSRSARVPSSAACARGSRAISGST